MKSLGFLFAMFVFCSGSLGQDDPTGARLDPGTIDELLEEMTDLIKNGPSKRYFFSKSKPNIALQDSLWQ